MTHVKCICNNHSEVLQSYVEWQFRGDGCSRCQVSCVFPSGAEVVTAEDGLWLSLGITVGMALVISLASPFEKPQVNVFHTCCFACSLAPPEDAYSRTPTRSEKNVGELHL